MSEPIVHFVNRRQPPLETTITTDGSTDPLPAGATLSFSMRPVASATLKVSAAAATVVSEPGNTGRYDWQAADVDTAGWYLGWWRVTAAGQDTDTPEFLIHMQEHDDVGGYTELEEVRHALGLLGDGERHADKEIQEAIVAASRGIDQALGRRFYPDPDATQVRFYTPEADSRLWVDDLVELAEVAVATAGTGSFTEVWTEDTDFVLGPLNAAADGQPYTNIEALPTGSFRFTVGAPKSVRITGKFGWAAPPAQIKTLTSLIAARLVRRTREAPFGIIQIGIDGAAVRAAGFARDPEYALLTHGFERDVPIG